MAALAYLFPPVSGLLVYLTGRTAHVRFHGLQSIVLGVAWPASMWVASVFPAEVVAATALLGAAAWLVLLIGTATGKNPRVPGAGLLLRAAEPD